MVKSLTRFLAIMLIYQAVIVVVTIIISPLIVYLSKEVKILKIRRMLIMIAILIRQSAINIFIMHAKDVINDY